MKPLTDATRVTHTPARGDVWTTPEHDTGGKLDETGTRLHTAVVSASQPSPALPGLLWLDTSSSSGAAGIIAVVTKTGDYTATASDTVILVDASSAAVTITLLTAVGNKGRVFYVKKIDSSANVVTIDGDGSETIDDATTQILTSQYDAVMIVSDGVEWFIL